MMLFAAGRNEEHVVKRSESAEAGKLILSPAPPLSGSKFKTNETKARELRLDSRMSANLESTPRI